MKSTLSALSLLLVLTACGPLANARADRIEARHPPDGRMIRVGDAVIHAQVEGHGPDLVLLHGAGGSAADMAELSHRLADRYRVIRFDRPGAGWSWDLGDIGLSPLVQADYLQAAAARMGVRDPIVLGQSYGGAVAMAWALERPDTRAVVLVSGAVMPWTGGRDGIYGLAATPLAEVTVQPLASLMPDWGLQTILRSLFRPDPVPEGYARDTGAEMALRPNALRDNLRQMRALKRHLYLMAAHYPELTLPIEVVHSPDDPIVGFKIHAVPLQALGNVHVTPVPGHGHMLHHTAPDAVIAAIDRAAARSD